MYSIEVNCIALLIRDIVPTITHTIFSPECVHFVVRYYATAL